MKQQIELLSLRREHLDNLIDFARKTMKEGVKKMDFKAFDKKKIDEYSKKAKEQWGNTDAYREYEEKAKGRTDEDNAGIVNDFMAIFAEFGELKALKPTDEKVQLQVKKLQGFITDHYYNCTNEILAGLGKMYAAGGEFTENIDKAGGEGTAVFTAKAIENYVARK